MDAARGSVAKLTADANQADQTARQLQATLAELPELGRAILKGGVRGRVVVDVNS